MPESPAFGLESPADAANNRKNGKREARKFGSGERGFQTGNYPRLGPFDIYQQRPSKKGGDQREGRTFYVLGEYPNRKPPAEGWVFFLARTYGPGTYRVHHNGGTERAVIYVSPDVVARASGIGADDDDDEGDDDAQPNPPAGSIASLIEQINTLNAAKELLTPAAQPSVLETLAKSPVLAAMLAQLAAPKPNPPPAAKAPPDPYETIARFAREMGITPEQAIKALAAARQQDDDEDDEGAASAYGPLGPLSPE